MTVRKPLFINSDGDLQEMTDAQVVLHQQKAIYQYSLDPSAYLPLQKWRKYGSIMILDSSFNIYHILW